MIGRILLTVAALAVTGFMLLVLIGLWDRYEQETAALGFQRDLREVFSVASRNLPSTRRAAQPRKLSARGPSSSGRS